MSVDLGCITVPMQRYRDCLILTLPDRSTAVLDSRTLSFYSFSHIPTSWEQAIRERILIDPSAETIRPSGIDIEVLAALMERPRHRFADCFTRCGAQPRYSFRSAKQDFDVTYLTKIYQFRGDYAGGVFSSSESNWRFLDGGIISHSGYGFGSHSWTAVEGAHALRVVYLFFGINQPRQVKGEGRKEPLAALVERMTANDVSHEMSSKSLGWPRPSQS